MHICKEVCTYVLANMCASLPVEVLRKTFRGHLCESFIKIGFAADWGSLEDFCHTRHKITVIFKLKDAKTEAHTTCMDEILRAYVQRQTCNITHVILSRTYTLHTHLPSAKGCFSTTTRQPVLCHFSSNGLKVYFRALSDRDCIACGGSCKTAVSCSWRLYFRLKVIMVFAMFCRRNCVIVVGRVLAHSIHFFLTFFPGNVVLIAVLIPFICCKYSVASDSVEYFFYLNHLNSFSFNSPRSTLISHKTLAPLYLCHALATRSSANAWFWSNHG